ncbi:phosphoglycerate dehydrogenase [Candidatus Neomarinimicrobiota bacterium]
MAQQYRILIATSPFGKTGRKPLDLLEATGWEIVHNPYGRRLRTEEVGELIKDFDGIIAGTEPYPVEFLKGSLVKVVSRVGIGLDNMPLAECRDMGIAVTYTPDAPSQGVAELTVANMINLCRQILMSDHSVREGAWNRYMGTLISELTIGVVGVGRIGQKVIRLLQSFNPSLLVSDIEPDLEFGKEFDLKWCDKEEIFRTCDLVTIHIPYNEMNHHYLDRKTIALMKTGSMVINTSRGPIADETALVDGLLQKHLGGAALDVFEKEPYEGMLTQFDNVVLTAHMGASATACRFLMELGAAMDCIRVLEGRKPVHDAIKENLD